jgi:hypothetical protein
MNEGEKQLKLYYMVDNVRHTSGIFFYRKLYNGGNISTT